MRHDRQYIVGMVLLLRVVFGKQKRASRILPANRHNPLDLLDINDEVTGDGQHESQSAQTKKPI